MSEHDVRQESSGEIPAKQLVKLIAAVAKMAEREDVRREHGDAVSLAGEASVAFNKYRAKFGWTEAQFAEYWPWRNDPFQKSKWKHLLDSERKRIKAEGRPRKNKRVKDMTPEEAKAHRRQQVRDAVKRLRAKTDTATSGEPLSDEELDLIAKAEAEQVVLPEQIAALLASLIAAEDAEGK